MHAFDKSIRLMHITTVPQTLWFLKDQVEYMKSNGFEVMALSSPGDYLYEFGKQSNIDVFAVEMPRRITPFYDLKALRQIMHIISKTRPHILHSHTPKGGLLGMIAARLSRVPVRIYHIHGLPYMTASGFKRSLLRLTEKVSCTIADTVICVSPSIMENAICENITRRNKTIVFGKGSINGVDADEKFNPEITGPEARLEIRSKLGIPKESRVLGFAGRIVKDKGIKELAYAWKQLREDYKDLYLLLVGSTEAVDPLPDNIENTLLSDERVIMTGFVMDMNKYYAAMDILVLPTYREGFGMVAIEASAMELPVVATKIPGCVDAVKDNETGILVSPYNADELMSAIKRYLDDAELREIHGKQGRAWVKKEFRQRNIWEATYLEYVRLLGEKGMLSETILTKTQYG